MVHVVLFLVSTWYTVYSFSDLFYSFLSQSEWEVCWTESNVSIAVSQGCLGADMKHIRRHVEKDAITIAHHKLPRSGAMKWVQGTPECILWPFDQPFNECPSVLCEKWLKLLCGISCSWSLLECGEIRPTAIEHFKVSWVPCSDGYTHFASMIVAHWNIKNC